MVGPGDTEPNMPDVHQRIFDGTVEANRLVHAVAEKVLGVDGLLKALDTTQVEYDAIDHLSHAEFVIYIAQAKESYAVSPSVEHGIFMTKIAQLIGNRTGTLMEFDFLGVEPGHIRFMRGTSFHEGKTTQHILDVVASGDATQTVQKSTVFDIETGPSERWQDETPDVTPEALADWLDDFRAMGGELLEHNEVELRLLIETI